jgi:hypothetical protein
MAARRRILAIWFGVAALLLVGSNIAGAEQEQVDNIKEAYARFRACWRPPTGADVHRGIDVTVIATFKRDGSIMGKPKVTYESEQATDHDRLKLRIAIMETLQRCTPMPFTDGMAGAVAGRPFAIRFRN